MNDRSLLLRWYAPAAVCGAMAIFSFLVTAAEPTKIPARDGKSPPQELVGMPLVFFDNFESEKADRWEQSAPQAWKCSIVRCVRFWPRGIGCGS